MPEAMKKIRSELGSDAVILNSKIIHTGGFFGFFAKKKIEVIAAIDPDHELMSENKIREKQSQQLQENSLFGAKQMIEQANSPQNNEMKTTENEAQLLSEIAQLKKLVSQIDTSNQSSSLVYPKPIQKVANFFTEQEINEHVTNKIMSNLVEKWFDSSPKPTETKVFSWAKQLLTKEINQVDYGEINYDKKFINVIGPTGVGKTTTLAKMAANAVLRDQKKAAFITTDTYRIAAIDQLKTYAKILCVPLEVCYTADDFKRALEKFTDYEVVFIDTAGRNFRNEQFVIDLKEMIQFNETMETFLVLALTAKQQDMNDIYKQFSKIKIDKLIFTKADETANYGAIINMINNYNIGVAYLTNGQDVPDDILAASPNVIINTIFGE